MMFWHNKRHQKNQNYLHFHPHIHTHKTEPSVMLHKNENLFKEFSNKNFPQFKWHKNKCFGICEQTHVLPASDSKIAFLNIIEIPPSCHEMSDVSERIYRHVNPFKCHIMSLEFFNFNFLHLFQMSNVMLHIAQFFRGSECEPSWMDWACGQSIQLNF